MKESQSDEEREFVEAYTLEKMTDPQLVAKFRDVLTRHLGKDSEAPATMGQSAAGSLFEKKTGASIFITLFVLVEAIANPTDPPYANDIDFAVLALHPEHVTHPALSLYRLQNLNKHRWPD